MFKNTTSSAIRSGDDVVAAFTDMAPTYEQTVDRELRQFLGLGYAEFIDRFLAQIVIHPDDRVLDVATGTAQIPMALAGQLGEQGKVVGLDITPEMLRFARDNVVQAAGTDRIELIGGSALEMPFATGTFDLVICGLGTHHMHVPTMLAQMRWALRPGGRILLADIAATPFWRSLIGKGVLKVLMWQYGFANDTARGRAELEAVANLRTASEWRQLIMDNGFTQVQIVELPARHRWYPSAVIIQGTLS